MSNGQVGTWAQILKAETVCMFGVINHKSSENLGSNHYVS